MASETLFVVGLGSNLGDRLQHLRRACELLASAQVIVVGRSQVVETPPAGGPPQGDYLNAAIALRTTFDPPELLDYCLAVERRIGRVRPDPVRWGPRPIDIDLLWWERGAHASDPELPHPRLAQRAFALQPLLELVQPSGFDNLPAAKVAISVVGQL